MATESQKAPDFELPLDSGGTLRLRELEGNPVVVYFYPKDSTPGCTREAEAFTALAPEFAEIGVRIVGISPDSLASHTKFRAKYELGIDLASDEARKAIEAYGVWVEKSMYGRKYMGVDRSTFLIDKKGRIARVWNKVKVPGHAEEVLAAAKELIAS